MVTGVPGGRARSAAGRAVTGARFADVRWVAETGSTNADAHGARPRRRAGGDRARGRPPDRRPGPAGPHLGGAAGGRRCCCRSCCARRRRWSTSCTMAVARRRRRGGGGGGRLRAPAEVAQRPRVARRRLGARPQAGRDPGRGRLAGRLDLAPAGGRPRRRAGRGGRRHRHQRGLARRAAAELADIAVACNHVTGTAGRPGGPARRPCSQRLGPLRTPPWSPRATAAPLLAELAGRARPRSAARCGSTSAPTTSRAPPSTSPTTATSSSRLLEGERRTRRRRRRHAPAPSVAAAGTVDLMSDGQVQLSVDALAGAAGRGSTREIAAVWHTRDSFTIDFISPFSPDHGRRRGAGHAAGADRVRASGWPVSVIFKVAAGDQRERRDRTSRRTAPIGSGGRRTSPLGRGRLTATDLVA